MTEVVLDCEDEFGISIPDAACEKMTTVGEFYDFVLMLTRSTGKPELCQRPDLEQHVWDRVRYFCVRPVWGDPQSRIKSITRETRFIEDLGFG